ncbi:MAG: arginyltransferase [Deltaproteobacteria bacterium]|nr:arginyltransferase [Deltaproteobacteria bacterium]
MTPRRERAVRDLQLSSPELLEPPELIVYDEPGDCSYLAGQIWRLPLRFPIRRLAPAELDRRLAAGDRRQGRLLYRTTCSGCRACEPLRVEVARFRPDRTQRRVLRRGDGAIQTDIAEVDLSAEKVALFNRHKQLRGLATSDSLLGPAGYQAFLVDSCCDSFELRYYVEGWLIGVAVVDRGEQALSAVYTYFDPDYGSLSPGAYSILKQIELCTSWGLSYLYLGLYVAGCPAMTYKARYLPHERLIDGRWVRFERAANGGP